MNDREKLEVPEMMPQEVALRGTQPTDTAKEEVRRRPPRDRSGEYIEKYLPRIDFEARQLIYVSKETHAALTSIVQIVGGTKANISSYVENIIQAHFDSNKEIINGLYANKFNPPLK